MVQHKLSNILFKNDPNKKKIKKNQDMKSEKAEEKMTRTMKWF